MPVLLKSTDSSVYASFDVDHLVSGFRERLCIKHHGHERMCSASSRRSAPYQLTKRPFQNMCEQCRKKHYSSPNSCFYQSHSMPTIQPVSSKSECYCLHEQRNPCRKSKFDRERKDSYQDPHVLLEKLIAEQSLIQEAVRRIQSRTSQENNIMCSAQKLFALASGDEDSNDPFNNQTPFSVALSESEDDTLSQHSIDL